MTIVFLEGFVVVGVCEWIGVVNFYEHVSKFFIFAKPCVAMLGIRFWIMFGI